MSNYYQEKKSYNKYNPSSSFSNYNNFDTSPKSEADIKITKQNLSDLDYFKKDRKNINATRKQINRTQNRSSNYNSYKNTKRIESKPVGSSIIVSSLIGLGIVFIFVFLFIIIGDSETVGFIPREVEKKLFINSVLGVILLIPIAILIYTKFISDNIKTNNEKLIVILVLITGVIAISIGFSRGTIGILNKILDTSIPVKRYLKVVSKRIKISHDSKRRREKNYYFIYLTSWISNETIQLSVNQNQFTKLLPSDIVTAVTRHGYYGIEYYDSINLNQKVDKNMFPPKTKFPLTYDEANNIIQEYQKSKELDD